MKRRTSLPRLAAVGLLFGTLAAIPAFTLTRSAIGSPGRPIIGPAALIETDGTLDALFNAGNITNGQVYAGVLQADGKLLIAGQFSRVHGTVRNGIARLNTDGTLDVSFDPGVGSDFGVGGIAVQTDGKIIISGFFQSFDGVGRQPGLARLNSSGSLDSSFNPGGRISMDGSDDGNGNATNPGTVNSVILQTDGKFVVLGTFFFIVTGPGTNVARSCVARFNSDGTFDPSYNPGAGAVHSLGTFNTFVLHAVGQNVGANAGKIILQGSFDSFDGHPVHGLARMDTNGSFDSTFDPGTATDESMLGLFVQADDKILAFGAFDSFNGVAHSKIVRLETSGAVDAGFSAPVFPTSEYGDEGLVAAVAQQPNGKLILGGYFHLVGGATANNVVRLETSGARDASFSPIGTGPSSWNVSAVVVRPSDGKIFFGGYFSTFGGQYRSNAAWANPDGSVDNSFAGLAGVTDYGPNIWAMETQSDGKILITGLFTSFNGTSRNNVLRLNPDATIDPSFNVDTDRSTRALLVQPDGKILIAGNFDEVNGVPMVRIARLNSDGTLDPSFDPGMGPDNYIRALALDSGGNIYAGGNFESFNGLPRVGLVKLSSTGAVDPAFNPGGGAEPVVVYAIAPPDETGGIVIGGGFTTYNGTAARRIARVNATTGALDSTFNSGGFGFNNGTVFAMRRAPDGKYYAGGNFSSFNGVARQRLARLNSNGSLDNAFAGPALTGTMYALALQNGKVYAGGDGITSPPGQILRLTGSGGLDPTFVTGTGFDISPVYSYGGFRTKISALAIQADGKLLAGGIFTHYNGTARTCLARLTGPIVIPTPTPTPTASPTPSASPTPTPTPTTTPSPSPGRALNISTRLLVQTGDRVGIGGFIITGNAPKQVLLRGIGPSLAQFGVPNPLADPVLELHGPSGFATIVNDNWRDTQIPCDPLGLPQLNDLESAICTTLNPGAYTAILSGKNNGSGVGLVEIYDVGSAASQLANISTRAFVGTGDNVTIGGFVLGGGGSSHIEIFGIGPSLASSGVGGVLADPTLELHDSSGALIASNDNCGAISFHPLDPAEACIDMTLPPGLFTAILAGKNGGTGIGLLEIYNLP
jgi:uncharacterized delta-60 repeat protein